MNNLSSTNILDVATAQTTTRPPNPCVHAEAIETAQAELKRSAPSRPFTPEELADILEEAHTRRAWWLDIHSSADFFTGTTLTDIDNLVQSKRGDVALLSGNAVKPDSVPGFFAGRDYLEAL